MEHLNVRSAQDAPLVAALYRAALEARGRGAPPQLIWDPTCRPQYRFLRVIAAAFESLYPAVFSVALPLARPGTPLLVVHADHPGHEANAQREGYLVAVRQGVWVSRAELLEALRALDPRGAHVVPV